MAHSFSYSRRGPSAPSIKGAADYLHSHERMSAIVPAVERLIAIRKDCAAIIPNIPFEALNWDAGQLTLAVPNSACATRLKQQLQQLQNGLLKRGWQVSAIRTRIQVTRPPENTAPAKQIAMSPTALAAFAELDTALGASSREAPLKNAVAALLRRHRDGA